MPRPRIYSTNAARQRAYRRRAARAKRKNNCVWSTPPDLFADLDQEFRFDLDVCALPENAKCSRYFTPEQDGLAQAWTGRVWCNPPYLASELPRWIGKAHQSVQDGTASVAVCLLPASTDARWWHDYVLPYAGVRYVRGRLKFGGVRTPAPFASALAIFGDK